MHPALFEILLGLGGGPTPASDLLVRLERIEETRSVPVATFYRQLKRGLEAGWIEVDDTQATSGPGRPGQIYRRTRQGTEVVKQEARRLRSLAERAALAEGDAR